MSDRVAGVSAGERFRSWAEIDLNAARAAGGFAALGIGEDDSVATMLRNDFATFEANKAAGQLGAYAVPINWHFTAEEAGYILADCAAKVLVVHADLLPQIASGIPAGVKVLVVPTPQDIGDAYGVPAERRIVPVGAAAWEPFLAASAPNTRPPALARGSMIYTSGTTGRPKGVRRKPSTPEMQQKAAAEAGKYWGLVADPSIVVLMNGPMYHSAPAAYGMGSARLALHVVLQARFEAEEMLRLIERHGVTHMHIVPTMFVRLLRLPDEVKRKYDLKSLRWITHGAAPCAPAVKRQMIEWWGPVVNEYYGATETGIVVWHNSEQALKKPGTVGRVVEGAVMRIVDGRGEDVKQGDVGEIYLRGPHLAEFTYNNDDAKRREIALDDLVTVGDIGYQDAEGFVFLCDRKRDMIISGGVNIYPAEIESVLIQMPGVRDCAVFGIPDEEFGEQICAHVELAVEPAAGAAIDATAVRSWLGQHVARYKVPRVVEFSAALPREDSGKIFKRKLRAPYWEKAGRSI
jgi:long-chain acyl-CoA synthetase